MRRIPRNACSIVGCTLLSGCIGSGPWAPSMQEIIVEITNATTGESVPEARIKHAIDFRPSFVFEDLPNDDANYLNRSLQSVVETDASGIAILRVHTTGVCTGLARFADACPDPLEDRVTGELFLVQIQIDNQSEFLSITMNPEATVSGTLFRLSVTTIGSAQPRIDSDS